MILEQADYSFNAATKEVTFNAPYNTIELQQIELIVNVVDNIIIYQFNKNTKGGTLAGSVLTLTYDTTAMSNGDILMVIVSVAQASTGLTDAELRATPVPVSGTINTGLTQPLTDAQLRATPVPVSGTVAVTGAGDATAANQTTEITRLVEIRDYLDTVETKLQTLITNLGSPNLEVTQISVLAALNDIKTYTDGLEALITASNVLLTTVSTKDFATQTTLALIKAKTDNLDVALSTIGTETTLAAIKAKTDNIPPLGQALAAASTPVVLTAIQQAALTPPAAITGFATETTLNTRLSESDFDSKTGSLTETAPVTDTASSGLNGRLQRIAQRLSTLITDFTAGTYKFIMRGGNKGATTAADVTSTAASADRQPLDVILRDSSGNTVSIGGGGTQYTEDAVSVGAEQLTLAGAVRQDILSANQSNDGDYSTLKTNAKGETYTKDTDVKSDTALLVTALNTLNETINSCDQQKVSVDDVYHLLRRVTQLLERPTYTNQFGEVRIVGGSVTLPTSIATLPTLANLTTLANMGILATDQSFVYQGNCRQLFNTYINKIIT